MLQRTRGERAGWSNAGGKLIPGLLWPECEIRRLTGESEEILVLAVVAPVAGEASLKVATIEELVTHAVQCRKEGASSTQPSQNDLHVFAPC